jgi:hypothetical protein
MLIQGGCRRKARRSVVGIKTEMGRVMTQNSNNAANNPDGPKPRDAAPSEGTKD